MLKPLSPVLQPSDLRSLSPGSQINSSLNLLSFSDVASQPDPDPPLQVQAQRDPGSPVLVQARHVSVFPDGADSSDEGSPSSSRSSGSQFGFYSFVEDPRSPDAELNEAWMVSPQRHAQLATLKMEKGFRLQTYAPCRKPQSLFSETCGDSQYRVDLNDGVRDLEEDEKHLREEIIRNQAPKKLLTITDRGSGVTSGTWELSPAAADTVNKESINFSAARQQFLRLEQDQGTSLLKPGSCSKTLERGSPQLRPEGNQHENMSPTEEDPTPSSAVEDMDSGLEGLSVEPGSGSSSHMTPTTRRSPDDKYETPIEREIRLVQQREQHLRVSRGLKISTAEIVEIKTRRLQSPLKAKNLDQGIQKVQKNEDQLKTNLQKQDDLKEEEKDQKEDERREERPESGDTTDFSSPCCPHRHHEEADRMSDLSSASEVQDARRIHPGCVASTSGSSSPSTKTLDWPCSWRESLHSSGLQSRKAGAPDFIEKEIEEVLKREEELRELRDKSFSQVCSSAPLEIENISRAAERQLQLSTAAGTGTIAASCSH